MLRYKRKKIRSITVVGRRWFDKRYGNTYCTCELLINGERVYQSGKSYGYGDYYTQLASDWLKANIKNWPTDWNGNHIRIVCQDMGNDIQYINTVADVSRERDLA